MDPTVFLAPESALGSPAPYWLLVSLKVLGFTLHLGPMHLWFAGLLLAALLRQFGGVQARLLSERLMAQMPLIISIGVNLGIVPLLFLQVSYYRVFYPATVLMAWPWFGVIALLTVAYYGVYIYAVALKTKTRRMTALARWAGWVSALLFIGIGFIFANALSLMTNLPAWEGLWKSTSQAGAPLGTALNVADPSLLPRYLMMFGLALVTCAAYFLFDACWFAASDNAAYRQWVATLAWKLGLLGVVWFALFGSIYVFITWDQALREAMLAAPLVVLTALAAVSPGLTWLVLLLNRKGASRPLAFAGLLMQFVALAGNAIARQLVQNRELAPYMDIQAERVNLQLSPLILFLLLFVGGVGLVVWMISKAVKAHAKPLPAPAKAKAK
jgi:hypothetical protein